MRPQSSRPAYPLAPNTPTGILCIGNAYYCKDPMSTAAVVDAPLLPGVVTRPILAGKHEARAALPPAPPMLTRVMNKRDRHRAILDIVTATSVGSQEELRQQLTARGLDVTQSTLSRDLHE